MLNSERRSSPGTPMWSFQSIVSHTASSWSESRGITSSTVLFTSMTASSETQVMDKLHPFFITLEYLNTCEFSFKAGPLKYLAELEEWRHENRGLALLLAADSLIRKKVHRVSSDQPKKFSTFSAALLEVLTNHTRVRSWTSSSRRRQAPLRRRPRSELVRHHCLLHQVQPRPRRIAIGVLARKLSFSRPKQF